MVIFNSSRKKDTKELRENDQKSVFVSGYKNCDILYIIQFFYFDIYDSVKLQHKLNFCTAANSDLQLKVRDGLHEELLLN